MPGRRHDAAKPGLTFHGRFDSLDEPAATRLVRCLEHAELLNSLQPADIRLRRIARDFIARCGLHAGT